jgi:microcystin-dependent protein
MHFDASKSNPIYGNSDTVQPNALTTRYIIKAFDGQTADSALIDITQYAEAVADARVPIGMMLPCATETARKNFLLCDGSAVSRDTYSALFAVIGTKYGVGDGSTTFNLPDYNVSGRFVQGGTTAGTVKSAGLPNITGDVGDFASYNFQNTGAFQLKSYTNYVTGGSANQVFAIASFNASRSSAIYGNSDTVQPPALTACWQIKYC